MLKSKLVLSLIFAALSLSANAKENTGELNAVIKNGQIIIAPVITNTNTYAIKDIAMRCDILGQSGTIIESYKTMYYLLIAPKQTKQMPRQAIAEAHPQAKDIQCVVIHTN